MPFLARTSARQSDKATAAARTRWGCTATVLSACDVRHRARPTAHAAAAQNQKHRSLTLTLTFAVILRAHPRPRPARRQAMTTALTHARTVRLSSAPAVRWNSRHRPQTCSQRRITLLHCPRHRLPRWRSTAAVRWLETARWRVNQEAAWAALLRCLRRVTQAAARDWCWWRRADVAHACSRGRRRLVSAPLLHTSTRRVRANAACVSAAQAEVHARSNLVAPSLCFRATRDRRHIRRRQKCQTRKTALRFAILSHLTTLAQPRTSRS
mmetsp:Transcript_5600/g.12772  ORF Transcript_5600/g.12772 Transcript_5600/m.12772 type:complete len:268 (-) Transcript_5600:1608-2411(-)